jgi:hypothetical protein
MAYGIEMCYVGVMALGVDDPRVHIHDKVVLVVNVNIFRGKVKKQKKITWCFRGASKREERPRKGAIRWSG